MVFAEFTCLGCYTGEVSGFTRIDAFSSGIEEFLFLASETDVCGTIGTAGLALDTFIGVRSIELVASYAFEAGVAGVAC